MTRIDFYVLQQNTEDARLTFAARLCEKACHQDMKVMIITPDKATSLKMDALLWDFKPESFLPHSIEGEPTPESICISHSNDDINHHDFLINLGFEVPKMFSRFQRLAEIVVQTPDTLSATRAHYGFYKQRGYPVGSHKLP